MLEQGSWDKIKENEHKRLSVITDILLLIPLIFSTIILIKSFKVTEYAPSSEVLSLQNSNLSIKDENELYISNIKKEFGITILYGEDVKAFATKVEATAQYDQNIINNNLKILYEALKKYPSEIFNMSISMENPIYIMLVDHFENNNLALASRNSLDEYRIYVSNVENLERAFHHEMYHVLEYYMAKDKAIVYPNWNDLNPSDFKYSSDTKKLDKKYVYDEENLSSSTSTVNISDCYFVTRYSKCSEKEDRAEIFAELMILKNTPAYLNKGENIRKKVDYIFYILNSNITESDFYCNRYIK